MAAHSPLLVAILLHSSIIGLRIAATDGNIQAPISGASFTVVPEPGTALQLLVGLGGQVLYPLVDDAGEYRTTETGAVLPHPDVGTTPGEFDQILVVVLKNHLPELMGPSGVILATLILVAIMAAAMSTADSNLHALSALITHDVYDQFVRPQASQQERTWVGRALIA